MKVGDKIKLYIFGALETAEVIKKNNNKTIDVQLNGIKYTQVQTFKTLPKVKSQIPPWYILK